MRSFFRSFLNFLIDNFLYPLFFSMISMGAAILAAIKVDSALLGFLFFIGGLLLGLVIFIAHFYYKQSLLFIDDQGHILQDLQRYFERHSKYYIRVSATVDDAINFIDIRKPKFAIIDLNLGKEGELAGIEIIKHILRKQKPTTHPIVLSGSPFEDRKQDFERVFTSPELEKIEKNYVHKGDSNYILNLKDKMDEVERQEQNQ